MHVRKLLFSLLFLCSLVILSSAQETHNHNVILKKGELKRVVTRMYPGLDTATTQGRLLYREDFDSSGRTTRLYRYTFWDVVSYDHTTTLEYNKHQQLSEKQSVSRYLNLGKRDSAYLATFGNDSDYTKITYLYDNTDSLVLVSKFLASDSNLIWKLDETTQYIYNKKGKLSLIIGSTPSGIIPGLNYTTTLKYDKHGRTIKKTKTLTVGEEKTRKFTYNKQGWLEREESTSSSSPGWKYTVRYVYDEKGHLIRKLGLRSGADNWHVISNYGYSEKGQHRFIENGDVYTYYDSGLIRSQIMTNADGTTIRNFITTYEFY
ncbi:MAG: hypothetical protein JJ975_15410 [Bacteroidia bacterium]|nr:hypothetical protein [Bacteroidia bacterium]